MSDDIFLTEEFIRPTFFFVTVITRNLIKRVFVWESIFCSDTLLSSCLIQLVYFLFYHLILQCDKAFTHFKEKLSENKAISNAHLIWVTGTYNVLCVLLMRCILCHFYGVLRNSLLCTTNLMPADRHARFLQVFHLTKLYLIHVI